MPGVLRRYAAILRFSSGNTLRAATSQHFPEKGHARQFLQEGSFSSSSSTFRLRIGTAEIESIALKKLPISGPGGPNARFMQRIEHSAELSPLIRLDLSAAGAGEQANVSPDRAVASPTDRSQRRQAHICPLWVGIYPPLTPITVPHRSALTHARGRPEISDVGDVFLFALPSRRPSWVHVADRALHAI